MLQKKAREETTVPSLVAEPKKWRDSPEFFPKYSEDMFILLSD